MKYLLLFCILTLTKSITVYSQAVVKIPKGNTILIDGQLSDKEWNDSKAISIKDNVTLYFKQNKDFVYIGVKCPKENYKGGWIDLFITVTKDSIYNLHASRKLGERKLKQGAWEDWSMWWTNQGRWTANYYRPDDIDENGKKKAINLKDEGWEFQINKNMFSNNEWKILFEISVVYESLKKIQYPEAVLNTQSEKWLLLKIK